MKRTQIRRLAGVSVAAALVLAALGAGPVAAKTPGWQFQNVKQLPATVAPNALAGFSFRIFNGGTSNISSLFLTDTFNGAAAYVANSRGTVCQTSPQLKCNFGALNSGAFIDVTVAYRVGTANLVNKFQLDSTGDPAGGNNSHGDSAFSVQLTTTVSSSVNFDGGFVIDDQEYATGGTLGNSNKQTSKVNVTDTLLPVTIEDGSGVTGACTIATGNACAHVIGEWTALSVPGNQNLIKVTLMVLGSTVPGGVGAGDIYLLHNGNTGGTYAITTVCDNIAAPTNAECIKVTKVGSNYKIEAWLNANGTLRGTW